MLYIEIFGSSQPHYRARVKFAPNPTDIVRAGELRSMAKLLEQAAEELDRINGGFDAPHS